ncbi:MAG: hypothetical protein Barrevirus4_11 [Barrevirus sp.]|uniref:Uncharacterized protein n=1 Tax=Barrevirus sp. TaxID=2487763 RepID=A0A3G4ZPX3_9VIRU|nr:MAG: hypothetical protein Barrevirus4_11 [Barrevirus sp.]
MGYDDNSHISYTTQGQLKVNNRNNYNKYFEKCQPDNISNNSNYSWITLQGKHVSLFSPNNPWYITKISEQEEKEKDKNKDKDKIKLSKVPKETFDRNNKDKDPVTESKVIDYKTIVSSLLLLITVLIIIRYYYFPKKTTI